MITKDTILGDILKIKGAEEILAKYKLPCLSCPMASLEINSLKVGEVCEMYKINTSSLLKELNSLK